MLIEIGYKKMIIIFILYFVFCIFLNIITLFYKLISNNNDYL